MFLTAYFADLYYFYFSGGLDDTLNTILSLCDEQEVTYVFALGRKAMGCAVGKLVPVSIVGIFDYNGVEVSSSKKT